MILQLQQILHVLVLLELLPVVEGVGLVEKEGVEHEMLVEAMKLTLMTIALERGEDGMKFVVAVTPVVDGVG